MKRITLSLLSLSLIFCSCTRKQEQPKSNQGDNIDSNLVMLQPTLLNVQLTVPEDTSVALENFVGTEVKVHMTKGYGQDSAFALKSAKLLEQIINSPEFKQLVLAQSYAHNQGMSAEEIYNKIITAHEMDGPGGSDSVLDLRLRIITKQEDGQKWINNCYPNSGTIGIDGGGTGIAAVCPEWLRMTARENHPGWLAAHIQVG